MKNFSLTYAGAIASLIASVTLLEQSEALNLVNALIVVITTLVTLYGRYRKGDLTILGARK